MVIRFARLAGASAAGAAWALLALASGCTTLRADVARIELPEAVARSSVRFQKEYLLTAGDQIEVSVWRAPEFSRTVFIGPDGRFSIPLVPDVQAAGRTAAEVAASVHDALARRLRDPEVTVIPVQVRPPTVYVLGDVKNPGAFPLRTAQTAAQALALAGGALRSASEGQATLLRLGTDGYLYALPLDGPGGQPGPVMTLATTPLSADDIVFIPEGERSQVTRALNDILLPLQIYLNYRLIQTLI